MSAEETQHGTRGPRGRLHLPRWRKGCYHGRPTSCCSLCWGRLALNILRFKLREVVR